MRLYITGPSPYARKCRIVVREKGLQSAVQEIVADPYTDDPDLVAANPIAQVPALVTADGAVFSDSPLICAWLDEIGHGPRLIPASGGDHWRVRRGESLADAGLEMGVKLILEMRRPESERSPTWLTRWRAGLERTLDRLEQEDVSDAPLDMGNLTTGVLLSWLDFRHPHIEWRYNRPRLDALRSALEARDSFKATRPDA